MTTTTDGNLDRSNSGWNPAAPAESGNLVTLALVLASAGLLAWLMFLAGGSGSQSAREPLASAVRAALNASAGLIELVTLAVVVFGVVVVGISLARPEK